MGTVDIEQPGVKRQAPLSDVTLVGRHRTCGLSIPTANIPLFWLEIRWLSEQWAWRALNQAEQTRGPGATHPSGWRLLTHAHLDAAIHLGPVRLRLRDLSPPEPLLEYLATHRRVPARPSPPTLILEGGEYKLNTGHLSLPLRDGDVFTLGPEPVRIWLPQSAAQTERATLSLESASLCLEFGDDPCTAEFSAGITSATIHGEDVRMLRVYAEAKAFDARDADCGYLTAAEAFDAWVRLGGNPESSVQRVSWLRNRLRKNLEEHDVAGGELFERRRLGATWQHRLRLASDRIFLPQPDSLETR